MATFRFSQICAGYELAAAARRLSPHTLADYRSTFRKFAAFLASDPYFIEIQKSQIEQFLATQPVSKKTVLNYHIGLSALWTWATAEGFALHNLLHDIQRPRPEKRAIQPFSEEDIRAMLEALASSKKYSNHGAPASNKLPNQERNRAIILLLLDTGLRADELCSALVRDLDLKNLQLKVLGKGDKERFLPICPRTGQALWKYLACRDDPPPLAPLFSTLTAAPMDRHRLLKLLVSIGKRANVKDVHPHRFRHTFAISYLRNGGDPYTLQMILGHSTMEMVKTYLTLAQADLQSMHRLASPVANMRL